MGGLGVLAWIPIGAAVGWTISRLMVGVEDDALRGTAAGMIGAVFGALGLRLLDSPPMLATSGVNASAAALAGSLWLTWIVCVVTSGRPATEGPLVRGLRALLPAGNAGARTDQATLTYTAARTELVEHLLRDAMAHDAGRYDDVGRRFATIEQAMPRGRGPELGKLRVALTFWDGWIDARNRGWRAANGGITKTEWPLLARTVAADLEGNRDMSDARVVRRFDAGALPPPGNRVQALAAWLLARERRG
jgi:hypothetical protein